jgi:hypothetical protein
MMNDLVLGLLITAYGTEPLDKIDRGLFVFEVQKGLNIIQAVAAQLELKLSCIVDVFVGNWWERFKVMMQKTSLQERYIALDSVICNPHVSL